MRNRLLIPATLAFCLSAPSVLRAADGIITVAEDGHSAVFSRLPQDYPDKAKLRAFLAAVTEDDCRIAAARSMRRSRRFASRVSTTPSCSASIRRAA